MSETETILAELAKLRQLVERKLTPRPVLDVAEACELVNVGSPSALQRWCARWRVQCTAPGRYARRALMAGLEREQDSAGRRGRTAKPKKETV